MIHVHYSNRLEPLVDMLAERIGGPTEHPLLPQEIAVSHPGMRRWLSLELASRLGIAANLRFPMPATLVWQLLRSVVPHAGERSPFEQASLRWAILGQLDPLCELALAEPIQRYLRDADALMKYELAAKLAVQMDRYLVYRPDWVRAWSDGRTPLEHQDEPWQGELLRQLRQRLGATDWLSVVDDVIARTSSDIAAADDGNAGSSIDALAAPLHLFGLTQLSPAYLELIEAFSSVREIHLYCLNPCREYWGDIVSERHRTKLEGMLLGGAAIDVSPGLGGVSEPEPSLYFSHGNPLLGSLGRVARELIDALQDMQTVEDERYVDPGEATLLHAVQSDIFTLTDRSTNASVSVFNANDVSIQLHACHSATREVEVLHDQLLNLFESHPDVGPSDVVVMTPRIDDYAAAIRGVFGHAHPDTVSIPFAVADRRPGEASTIVSGFQKLFDTVRGRFAAEELLGLLSVGPIQRRFRMPVDAVVTFTEWVRASGIRWGLDGPSRRETVEGVDERHTWQFGLDRLLLGIAMDTENLRVHANLAPFEGSEGLDHDLLEHLLDAVQALGGLAKSLRASRSVDAWCALFQSAARDFFLPIGSEEVEMQALLRGIEMMRAAAAAANFDEPIDISTALADLVSTLPSADFEQASQTGAFFSGRVTFCEMVPMRSIPFQVVCLLGMNDGAYPRGDSHPSFDLTQAASRRGDRTRRDDDRYLFLECILAARQVLYISHVGIDIRENEDLPPSPLVAELLDYIAAGYGSETRDAIATRHPLQPFSPKYFRADGPLFSYEQTHCRASNALVAQLAGQHLGEAVARADGVAAQGPGLGVFVTPPLERPALPLQVNVEDFVACFLHPAKFFLQERLGVRIEADEDRLPEAEPFVVETLERYKLRSTLLEAEERGAFPDAKAFVHANGQLPGGTFGDVVFDEQQAVVERFVSERDRVRATETLRIELPLDNVLVFGPVGRWCPDERVLSRARLASLRDKDRVDLWIRHLLANAVFGDVRSRLVTEKAVLCIEPIENAIDILNAYADAFLTAMTRPIPFFPNCSVAYVTTDASKSLSSALTAWQGTRQRQADGPGLRPDCDDPYNVIAYRSESPINEEFVTLATRLLDAFPALADEQSL